MVNARMKTTKKDPVGAPLGNTTESAAVLSVENAVDRLGERLQKMEARFQLRFVWQKITSLDRCRFCGFPLPAGDVRLRVKDGRSHYAGVAACGNAWSCPVCSAKVRFKRGMQVSRIVITASAEGCGSVFVTWTMAHSIEQSLVDNLALLTECKRWVTSQWTVKDLRKRLGYIGNLSAKEIPFGRNGAHPHMHDIEFFERPLSDSELIELNGLYYKFANRFYLNHGHKGLHKEHGITSYRAELSGKVLADYITKLQDGEAFNIKTAREVTRADTKKGRRGSMMYLELLADFAETGDMDRVNQVREYEQAVKGRAVIYVHKNVRARFLPSEPDKTDEELAAEEVGGEDRLEFSNWYFTWIKKQGLDGKVLGAYDRGGYDKVVELLMEYGMLLESGMRLTGPNLVEKGSDPVETL